jgi:hypothetical protein
MEIGLMTKTQAAELQAKWGQQGGTPICEHPIQEFARLVRSDEGYLMGTYHCRECGEASVHTHKPPAFTPLID